MNPVTPSIPPRSEQVQPPHAAVESVFELTQDALAILQAAIPEKARELSQDILTFWKELPRLLADGEEGRYALLQAGGIVSLWDTLNDATQAGYDKFGPDGRFTTACIKSLELQRIKQFLAQQQAKQCQV